MKMKFLAFLTFLIGLSIVSCISMNLQAKLVYQNLDDKLYIVFSDGILLTGVQLQDKIQIIFDDFQYGQDYDWKLTETPFSNLFQIKLDYFREFFTKQITLRFRDPTNIISNSGDKLSISSFVIATLLGPVRVYDESDNDAILFFKYALITLLSLGTLVNIIFSFMIERSLCMFWGMIDNLQVFYLLLYMDHYWFGNVKIMLSTSGFANLFFNKDFPSLSRDNHSNTLETIPNVHQEENFYSSMIDNFLIQFIIMQIILFFQQIYRWLCYQIETPLAEYCQKVLFFQGFIRIFMCFFCQMFFSSLVYFKYSQSMDADLAVVVMSFAEYVYFFSISLKILNDQNANDLSINLLDQKQFKGMYGVLYDGLTTKAIMQRNFNIFTMGRKAMLALVLITTDNFRLLQISFLMAIQIVYLTIFTIKMPYTDNLNDIITVISEIIITFVITILCAFRFFLRLGEQYYTYSSWQILSWVVVVLIFVNTLLRFVYIFVEFLRIRYFQLRGQKFSRRRQLLKSGQNSEIFKESPDDFEEQEVSDLNFLISQEQYNQMRPTTDKTQDSQSDGDYQDDDENSNRMNQMSQSDGMSIAQSRKSFRKHQ